MEEEKNGIVAAGVSKKKILSAAVVGVGAVGEDTNRQSLTAAEADIQVLN